MSERYKCEFSLISTTLTILFQTQIMAYTSAKTLRNMWNRIVFLKFLYNQWEAL
ncbi:unnamed protein product [Caenorhabditis brenneri]